MTWSKAFLPLGVAIICDVLGFVFSLLGIFGPALAGFAAKVATSGTGETVSTTLGALVAGGSAYFGGAGLEFAGTILAMVTGFFAWMTVGLIMLTSNFRIFEGMNTVLFASALLIDELPIINCIPALSWRVFKMYRAQIKEDKKKFTEYEASQKQERALELRRATVAQVAEAQELANDETEMEEQEELQQEEEIAEQEQMNTVIEQEALMRRDAGNDATYETPNKLDEVA
jgi:flagellar biosynthesis GTPase FlhF